MELLAHISAPSTRKHDARYRQQAANYGLFEANERQVISTASPSAPNERIESLAFPLAQAPAPSSHSSSSAPAHSQISIGPFLDKDVTDPEIGGLYLGNTLQAVAALESQIITSSLREALENGSESQFSLEPSDMTLSQRPPGVLLSPKVANDSSNSQIEDAESDARGTSFGEEVEAAANEASNIPSSSWSNEHIPTELPSTYEVSEETSGSAPARASGDSDQTPTRKRKTQEDVFPELLSPVQLRSERSKSDAMTTTSLRHIARSSPHRSPQRVDDRIPEQSDPTSLPPPQHSSPLPQHSSPPPQHSSPPLPSATLSSLPLLLHPPPPPTSLLPSPTTFLTPTLSSLSSTPSLSDRFRPAHTSRPISPSERGHWSFSLSAFSQQQVAETWGFLARVVQGGSAGWGVWCAREDAEARVYCFGETVGEVYLLLYVASRSRVRKAGAVWKDAAGEVVVSMR